MNGKQVQRIKVKAVAEEDFQEPVRNLREQIIDHVLKFSLASLIGAVGRFFSNYFGALLLGPSVWGIWQGVKLVLLYGPNLHFGAQNGMHRELPILRGKNELERQGVIINVTFTFSFVTAVVVSLCIWGSTFTIKMMPELRLSLRFVAVMVFFQYFYSFYGILLRANNQFDIVSRVALIDGLSSVLSVALIFPFGLLGFLGGQVIRILIATVYSWWKSPYNVYWQWDGRILKSLILIGFPIMLMIFAHVIFTTIDRLLILNLLDTQSLGFYSLGNLVFAPLLMIFTASNSVMYPRFGEKYGETGDPRTLRRYIIVPMESLAVLMSVLIGVIYIALPLLVKVFLPEYSEGIRSARVLIFGLFFYAIAGMVGNMLLSIGRQILRLWILLGSALLNLGLSYIGLKLGYGIVGVAFGTSLSYLAYFLISSVVAMRYAQISLRDCGKILLKVMCPVFCIGAIVVSLTILMPLPYSMGEITLMIKRTLMCELVLVLVGFYPVWRIYRILRIK